ncbi:ferrous iron transport protein A [Balneola sp. MJW-20]|uniref:FeoA family protein n=1 Tax=Gracilimonas aurantiaca TaxID=3234185 RepID=UPI003465713F
MLTPLSNTRKGEHISIKCLSCNCTDTCRLQELGCVEGSEAKVVSNQENVILQIGETRIAISGVLAKTILVSTN